ncbi:carbamoyl-phosphate synthase L chain, ATP binding domain-containing protein [Xylaria flabelliformis]|nr:carbamoyl-phosphate synthase L chain, ATP binding domain-containing protein [Xylaria flabelliformis]
MGVSMVSDLAHGPSRGPIKRLLIANRGEIAKRIIDCARELSIETFALITPDDASHALGANHALPISSPASYLDIQTLIEIGKQHAVDAVHPGYGFLSESAEFAQRMWNEAKIVVIGPGWDILSKTGDKLAAKLLAEQCGVPTLPAMDKPTAKITEARDFARKIGFPIMLKAVDGGGGKGIRLVRQESDLENAMKRAISESPSRQIFVEKAAVDGFRHIEVQIVGDGFGSVRHLWERECSIQRRYQKIIEQAPSTISDRKFIGDIIGSAMRMARHISYLSLGTFEFLANADQKEFFFLEVNPRLQVEHTVTECISLVDLVKIQLEIAQGAKLAETEMRNVSSDIMQVPNLHAIQLRLTAENVHKDWTLSIGRVEAFSLPTGHGVRIDTHLNHRRTTIIGADYDSLLAKIIVTGEHQQSALSKCRRALEDTWIEGVKTNLDVLRAIVAHQDFQRSLCDTSWLERKMSRLLVSGSDISRSIANQHPTSSFEDKAQYAPSTTTSSNSAVMLRKGDAWALKMTSPHKGAGEETHHIKLTRVIRNEFPSSLKADIEYSHPNSQQPQAFTLEAVSSNASSAAIMAAGRHRRGDVNNPHHVVVPFPGKLVELAVDEGDEILPGQVVCIVQQMKMELEIRATRGGRVKWVTDAEDGEDIAEGTLAAELEDSHNNDKPRALL